MAGAFQLQGGGGGGGGSYLGQIMGAINTIQIWAGGHPAGSGSSASRAMQQIMLALVRGQQAAARAQAISTDLSFAEAAAQPAYTSYEPEILSAPTPARLTQRVAHAETAKGLKRAEEAVKRFEERTKGSGGVYLNPSITPRRPLIRNSADDPNARMPRRFFWRI